MTFDVARLFRDLRDGSEYMNTAGDDADDLLRAADYYGYARALRSIAESIQNGDYDGD